MPDDGYAIKTWRYLRLAMIALVVGLAAAVIYERTQGHCWQRSISAFYYTPAQGYFVGALVSIGVCLFCLRGNTDLEDVLLNLAGMLAPVVAFVPTTDINGKCASILRTATDPEKNVLNNVTALLVVGFAGLAALIAFRDRNPSLRVKIGFGAAAAIWLAITGLLLFARDWFVANAHDWAATTMFLCIVAVAVVNARAQARQVRNPYAAVAVAMVAALILFPLAGHFLDWDHWVLWIEGVLISLFVAFWAIQTKELWHEGLRPVARRASEPPQQLVAR
jgi:hypothetical protein